MADLIILENQETQDIVVIEPTTQDDIVLLIDKPLCGQLFELTGAEVLQCLSDDAINYIEGEICPAIEWYEHIIEVSTNYPAFCYIQNEAADNYFPISWAQGSPQQWIATMDAAHVGLEVYIHQYDNLLPFFAGDFDGVNFTLAPNKLYDWSGKVIIRYPAN